MDLVGAIDVNGRDVESAGRVFEKLEDALASTMSWAVESERLAGELRGQKLLSDDEAVALVVQRFQKRLEARP